VVAMTEPVKTHFLWRPQLRDPGDEMVLETAVNGASRRVGYIQRPGLWYRTCAVRDRIDDPSRGDSEDEKMTETMTYSLRLPRSLKRAVERQSEEDGTSINQFVATAVAEKLSALQTAEFFADRKARADFKAFDKLMKRRGGTPPRTGDEMPDSKTKTSRHVRNNP
jgi:hypothetical protein